MKKCLEDYSLIEIIEHLIKLNKLHHFYEVEKTLKGAPKKEIELEDGQIYYNNCDTEYYLLVKHGNILENDYWKLVPINDSGTYWGEWRRETETKYAIIKDFTLCPNATITVKE